jgi:hypothetical protein
MITTLAALLILGPVCTTDTHVCAPQCVYEDGNPNGQPCLWVDPDTGNAYYVASENYK